MRDILKNKALEIAAALFCCWQAADLLSIWQHSPFDRLGGIGFAIWLIPVVMSLPGNQPAKMESSILIGLALGAVVCGRLLDVNALLALGLALALAAFVPFTAAAAGWLIGAFAWMPIFGWLLSQLPVNAVAGMRLVGAALASAIWLRAHRNLKTT